MNLTERVLNKLQEGGKGMMARRRARREQRKQASTFNLQGARRTGTTGGAWT